MSLDIVESGATSGGSALRGPKPQFTRAEILTTAIGVVRATGLEGFTLRVLAEELGVTQMALYRYFPSKDALLEAMLVHALEPVTVWSPGVTAWDERLTAALHALYETLVETPVITQLIATRKPGEMLDPFRRTLLGVALDAGFSESFSKHAIRALTNYVLGASLIVKPRQGTTAGKNVEDSFPVGLTMLMDSLRAKRLSEESQR